MNKLVITLIALSLLVSACNSQSPATETNPEDAQTQTETSEESSEESESTSEESATTESAEEDTEVPQETASAGSSEASERLMEFFGMPIEYMVDYTLVATTDGQTTNSAMIQYLKGTSKFRTDSSYEGMESRLYRVDEQIISCFKQDNAWSCMDASTGQQKDDDVQKDVKENVADYTVTPLPGRTIAGADTECFRIVGTQFTVDYCYSEEGVPLYVHSMASGVDSEMTATRYSTSVSDADFEFPAEPSAGGMPALPDGMQLPEGMEIPNY